MTFDVRVKVYAPYGAQTGILPAPTTLGASLVASDVGSLALKVPAGAPGAALLDVAAEVALEVPNGSGGWQEAPGGRFLTIVDKDDEVADPTTRPRDHSLPSYAWLLSKAIVLAHGALNADGKRQFDNVTAGGILRTLLLEAQGRGALSGLDVSTFSATTDSAGAPWTLTLSQRYDLGRDYLAILLDMAATGVLSFTTQGRQLLVYNADTQGVDRTTGPAPVVLQRGRDVTEAPVQRTREFLAGFVVALGDNKSYLERNNPSATAPWGRWEASVASGGVYSVPSLTAAADASLAQTALPLEQHTHGLALNGPTGPKPFVDYGLLDYVFSGAGQAAKKYRVRQITLARDEKGATTGNVVLNDRLLEDNVRLSRRVKAIGGTSGSPSGGVGSEPSGLSSAAPNPPTAVTVNSTTPYLDANGVTQVAITASWTAPTLSTDGSLATDLDRFDVSWEKTAGAAAKGFLGTTPAATPTLSAGPVPAGVQLRVSVVAVDKDGNRSDPGLSPIVTTATDTEGFVDAPATPVVAPFLGGMHVTWNGLLANDAGLPVDFDRVEVHASTSAGFTPTAANRVGTMRTGGRLYFQPVQAYGAQVHVRLVAVDRSGNTSASASAFAVRTRVSGLDVADDAITTTHIADAAVDRAQIADLAVGTAQIEDLAVTSAKVQSLIAEKIATGELTAGVRIIAGPETGVHAELTSTGFRVFGDGDGDGIPEEVVRLGTDTDDYFGVTNALGDLIASIDSTGRVSGTDLVVPKATLAGRDLSMLIGERGMIVGRGVFAAGKAGIGTEDFMGDMTFPAVNGRSYLISVSPVRYKSSSATGYAVMLLRDGLNGQAEYTRWTPPALTVTADFGSSAFQHVHHATRTGNHSVLLSVAAAGGGTIHYEATTRIVVTDLGPTPPETGRSIAGVGGATTAAVQAYTLENEAVWTGSYRGDNTRRTDTTDAIQGQQSPNGNQRALIGFPDVTGVLSGATVTKVEVFLYANHWYNNSGGTGLIGVHGHTNMPATYGAPVQPAAVSSPGWPKPGGRWVDISSVGLTNWKDGSYRGVMVGPGSTTGLEFYGRFAGSGAPSNRPRLRISYTK